MPSARTPSSSSASWSRSGSSRWPSQTRRPRSRPSPTSSRRHVAGTACCGSASSGSCAPRAFGGLASTHTCAITEADLNDRASGQPVRKLSALDLLDGQHVLGAGIRDDVRVLFLELCPLFTRQKGRPHPGCRLRRGTLLVFSEDSSLYGDDGHRPVPRTDRPFPSDDLGVCA